MYAFKFIRGLHRVPNNLPLKPDTNISARKVIKFITPEKVKLEDKNDDNKNRLGEKHESAVAKGKANTSINLQPTKGVDRRPEWAKRKEAVKKNIKGERWNPSKKLSKTEMEGVRLIKRHNPDITSSELAAQFKVSPEAIRRILKSKWVPTEEEEERIQERWKRRGQRIRQMYGKNPNTDTDERIAKRLSLGYDRYQKSMEIVSIQKEEKTPQGRNTKPNKRANDKLHLLRRLIKEDGKKLT